MLDAESVAEKDIALVRERFPERYRRACLRADRRDSLSVMAGGVLLFRALGVRRESELSCEGGRPYLPGGREFSLSHSGGRCAIAVSGERIGLDIELMDPGNLIAAPAALTEEELEFMRGDPLRRFHLLWTRKESVFKAVGGYDDPKPIPALDGRAPRGVHFTSGFFDGYAVSVCSAEEPGQIIPKNIFQIQTGG